MWLTVKGLVLAFLEIFDMRYAGEIPRISFRYCCDVTQETSGVLGKRGQGNKLLNDRNASINEANYEMRQPLGGLKKRGQQK